MFDAFYICLSRFSVHILSAKAHPELEEGPVRHGAGQCRPGSHRSSAEKAGEKKEAGDAREGGPEDSRSTRGADEARKTLVV